MPHGRDGARLLRAYEERARGARGAGPLRCRHTSRLATRPALFQKTDSNLLLNNNKNAFQKIWEMHTGALLLLGRRVTRLTGGCRPALTPAPACSK